MVEINPKDVFDVLLESLKIQAEKYKTIISQDALTHEQRKDYDSEIKQMYELLSSMTNSSTVYTLSEIQTLKTQYELKIQELQTTLDNIDVTTVKGDAGTNGADGLSAYQVAVNNGFAGSQSQWLESLKGSNGLNGTNGADGQNGIDGKDFTYSDFTPEQLALLKGEKGQDGINGTNGTNGIDGTHGLDGDDGLSAYQIAVNNGFAGSEIEWLESLKGADGQNGIDGTNGKDFTYLDFTPEQLALLKGEKGQDGIITFADLTPEQIATLKGVKGDSFTYSDFTAEQLASLKGADGQNGIDGTNGLDGDNGLSAYQIAVNNGFSGSEIQWLESLKGADGQNGIDGQSLTYADLTEAEKLDLASHVTVSGGSANLNFTSFVFDFLAPDNQNCYNLKTDLNISKISSLSFEMFRFSRDGNSPLGEHSGYLIKSNANKFFTTTGNYFFFPYVSSDGYLCFSIESSGVRVRSILNFCHDGTFNAPFNIVSMVGESNSRQLYS